MYRLVESVGLPLTACERYDRDFYPALGRIANARLVYFDAAVLEDYVGSHSVSGATLMSGLGLVDDLEGFSLADLSCFMLRSAERSLRSQFLNVLYGRFLTYAYRDFLLMLADFLLAGSDYVVNGDYGGAATRRNYVGEVLDTLRFLAYSEGSTLEGRLDGLRASSMYDTLEDVYLVCYFLVAASGVYRVDDVRLVALLGR